jgi:hypothetical protein
VIKPRDLLAVGTHRTPARLPTTLESVVDRAFE